MTQRKALFSLLLIGGFAAAPLAFAQDAQPATQADASAQAATPATPATPADPTTDPATPATPADPATPAAAANVSTKQVSWSELDADKNGTLSKTEAASLESLGQVFDAADADKDGALTADEYRAYLAANGHGAAHGGR